MEELTWKDGINVKNMEDLKNLSVWNRMKSTLICDAQEITEECLSV